MPRQIEFAQTIKGSGEDLLRLINDILDLSKIESGTVSLDLGPLGFDELTGSMERTFRHVADEKGLSFDVQLAPELPPTIHTDAMRLEQLLKNLLSNALKFTEHGGVVLDVRPATDGWSHDHPHLSRAREVIAFSVTDTGIGIPRDKQQLIFEAFHQAEGGTSRKYGGTGLGLAISREIARLLRGEIKLVSAPGEGSTFTFFLPQQQPPSGDRAPAPWTRSRRWSRVTTRGPASAQKRAPAPDTPPELTAVHDDAENIEPGDTVVLVVEDDPSFARTEVTLARDAGMKAVVANRGWRALEMARRFQPAGILLDRKLPDMDGWDVLKALKEDLETRHIPVYVVTVRDEPQNALRSGALSYLLKPVTSEQIAEVLERVKNFPTRRQPWLLIIEEDEAERARMCDAIGLDAAHVTAVGDLPSARDALASHAYQAVVLDLKQSGESAADFLNEIRAEFPSLPIIVYTAKDLTPEEESVIARKAQEVIVKDVRSRERLLDEVMLRLHCDVNRLAPEQQEIIRRLHGPEERLDGRKVLVVDDDIRNIFALTSVLEGHGMVVVPAETGPEALASLGEHPDVDVVLMDIMLPEMDGYETMRRIRENPAWAGLPLIAVTAKAMAGDREKCLEAGANDYLSKPVDPDKLLSMLRAWVLR
jgi:CheY-like chemotaxis protein